MKVCCIVGVKFRHLSCCHYHWNTMSVVFFFVFVFIDKSLKSPCESGMSSVYFLPTNSLFFVVEIINLDILFFTYLVVQYVILDHVTFAQFRT